MQKGGKGDITIIFIILSHAHNDDGKVLAAGQEAEGRAVERAGGKYFRAQVASSSLS